MNAIKAFQLILLRNDTWQESSTYEGKKIDIYERYKNIIVQTRYIKKKVLFVNCSIFRHDGIYTSLYYVKIRTATDIFQAWQLMTISNDTQTFSYMFEYRSKSTGLRLFGRQTHMNDQMYLIK